jgi:hypothetical protein
VRLDAVGVKFWQQVNIELAFKMQSLQVAAMTRQTLNG